MLLFSLRTLLLLVLWKHAIVLANSPLTQTAVFKGVPENWAGGIDIDPFVKIGEKYYFIETKNNANFFHAWYDCIRRNAQLVSVETAQEFDALAAYFVSKNWNLWIWTSGTDLSKEGTFSWLGSGNPMRYTRWAPGQPDNRNGNEHCVHLLLHNGKWVVNDQTCASKMSYICEAQTPRTIAFTVW